MTKQEARKLGAWTPNNVTCSNVSYTLKPSEQPAQFQWETHYLSYRVPVVPGRDTRADEKVLDEAIVALLKNYYEGGKMADMPVTSYIWEVALVEEPTVEAKESGATSRLILAPTVVLAASRDAAIALATKSITEEWDSNRTRVVVRVFQGNDSKY